MPGVHAPSARDPGDARPPRARVGRDARARPASLRDRRAQLRSRRRSAQARSQARRCRCPSPPNAMRNTIDAVADRDFVLDYLYACTVLFVHLSRISEEICLWATSEFGFASLPENAATGSSMMPQKLNPDVAELTRGKAGTAIGRLTGLLATVKSLPLAYNSDLAEDKQATFRARRDVRLALPALTVLVAGTRVRPRPHGCRCVGSAAARDGRGGGARRAGNGVPRRARADRRGGSRGDVRAGRAAHAAIRCRSRGGGSEGAMADADDLPCRPRPAEDRRPRPRGGRGDPRPRRGAARRAAAAAAHRARRSGCTSRSIRRARACRSRSRWRTWAAPRSR